MQFAGLGRLYAVCDHFEGETGKPVRASVLRKALGLERNILRALERAGKLDTFYVKLPNGQVEKAYLRPKDREKQTYMPKDLNDLNKIQVYANGQHVGTAEAISIE